MCIIVYSVNIFLYIEIIVLLNRQFTSSFQIVSLLDGKKIKISRSAFCNHIIIMEWNVAGCHSTINALLATQLTLRDLEITFSNSLDHDSVKVISIPIYLKVLCTIENLWKTW